MKLRFIYIFPIVISACSTTIEEQASQDYEPVYPVEIEHRATVLPSGSIYASGRGGLFAMDRRAAQVGDILTVELDESFSASKQQTSSGNKSNEFDLTLPGVFRAGLVDKYMDGGTDQSFSGSGQASQSNSLTGRMSVSVVRILPGGNLEILGQKKLTLNNGDEYIRLRGIVRPADIGSDNIVLSNRIANAVIKYIGAGQLADTAKPGWLRRAASTVSPF